MTKNTLVKNTLILLFTSLLIKVLGLVNRVILTRLLGNEGISLYMLVLPSIMFFISLGSLSLNITMTKMVAKKNSFNLIRKALLICIYSSFAISFLLLLVIKPLTNNWLKQSLSFYPILLTIPLIFLSAINSVLRGYYNGIKKVSISSISIIIEQITRIVFSIYLLLKFYTLGIAYAVSIAVIAMIIGEIGSIIYVLTMLKRYRPKVQAKVQTKEILDVAIPITLSRLIGNVTYFLEPIIFTFSLSLLNKSSNEIMLQYSEVNAYAIPLITMFSFISIAIGGAIIPHVATSDHKTTAYYITTSILYSILPAIPITLIITNYAEEYMFLIYNTKIGVDLVKKYCVFFILYYLQSPLIAIMQASNHTKSLLILLGFADVIKIALIFILPFIINDGLIIALLISSSLVSIMMYIYLKSKYAFKWQKAQIINILIIIIIHYFFVQLLKIGNINYLLSSALIGIVFLCTIKYLRIFSFHNK